VARYAIGRHGQRTGGMKAATVALTGRGHQARVRKGRRPVYEGGKTGRLCRVRGPLSVAATRGLCRPAEVALARAHRQDTPWGVKAQVSNVAGALAWPHTAAPRARLPRDGGGALAGVGH